MLMTDGHDDHGDGDGNSDDNLGSRHFSNTFEYRSFGMVGSVVLFVSWTIAFKYALCLPSISDQFNAHCRPDWG